MLSFILSFLVVALISKSTVVASVLPRANSCGLIGYSTNSNAYFYNVDASQANYEKCSTACLKDTSCKSFAFGHGVCMFFTVAVSGNFKSDNGSPFGFYDKSCAEGITTTSSNKVITTTTTITYLKTTIMTAPVKAATTIVVEAIGNSKASSSLSTSKPNAAPSASSDPPSTPGPPTGSTIMASKGISTSISSSSTTSTASADGVRLPEHCQNRFPELIFIGRIEWFNSSHNLDCVKGPDVGDGTGCLNGLGQWCNPKQDANCTKCGIKMCSPNAPPQPLGYGPSDKITVNYGTPWRGSCSKSSSGWARDGNRDVVTCGEFLKYYGNSNNDRDSALVTLDLGPSDCDDGRVIRGHYRGYIDMSCTRDNQGNATCISTGEYPNALRLPLLSYEVSDQ